MSGEQNVPPEQLRTYAFVFRQVLGGLVVLAWLAMEAYDFYTGQDQIPLWMDALGAGVLAYLLGVSVTSLIPGGFTQRPVAQAVVTEAQERRQEAGGTRVPPAPPPVAPPPGAA